MRARGGGAGRRDAAAVALFETAIGLHEQGDLAAAERHYRMVLAKLPGHVGALHRLGLVRAQRGAPDEGVGLLRRALRREPTSAPAHTAISA